MENLYKITAYSFYLPLAIGLTAYTATVLFKNSKTFMLDIFRQRESIAFATNNLFKVGFYLLSLGVAFFTLKIYVDLENGQETFEALSFKLGAFSVYLGVMLFLNLYLFFRGKKKTKQTDLGTQVKAI